MHDIDTPESITADPLRRTAEERAAQVLETIRAQIPRMVQAREVPGELLADLIRAGLYRMAVPHELGGDALDLATILGVVRILSAVDGAVGWSVSQGALAQLIVAHLPPAALQELYDEGPDCLIAGAFAPKGHATASADGWRISGQWPFVSGGRWSRWFYVNCLVTENRKVILTPNGVPRTRLIVLDRSAVEILDTWRVLGLEATASHDVRVSNAACEERFSCDLWAETSWHGTPIGLPLASYAGLFVAAVAAGIAEGALADVRALAKTGRRPSFSPARLADSQLFHERLGTASLQLEAAAALLHASAGSLMQLRTARADFTIERRARAAATCSQVVSLCTEAVNTAYSLAGGSSVFDSSCIQRRFRDIHTLSQHAWNSRDHATRLGAVLSGAAADTFQI